MAIYGYQPLIGLMFVILLIILIGRFASESRGDNSGSRLSAERTVVTKDLSSCRYGKNWNKLFSKASTSRDNEIWGAYRPGLYFGMKTKSEPDFLSSGVLWTANSALIQNFRHLTNQDELNHMTWLRHDGNHFGIQTLLDTHYDMDLKVSFVMPKEITPKEDNSSRPTWTQRFNLTSASGRYNSDQSLIFYFGLDCDGNLPTDKCINHQNIKFLRIIQQEPSIPGMTSSLVLLGYNRHSGWFNLEVNLYSNDSPELELSPTLSYWLPAKNTVSEAITRLQDPQMRQESVRGHPSNSKKMFTNDMNLNNKVEINAGVAVFQARAIAPLVLEVSLYEHINVKNEKDAIKLLNQNRKYTTQEDISHWLNMKTNEFEKKFQDTFQLEKKIDPVSGELEFSPTEIETGRHALSAVLGGIGYFHGTPEIGDAIDFFDNDTTTAASTIESSNNNNVVKKREAVSLFCTTPSRTSFPRGFLWDEGFHQLLVGIWDPNLSMKILKSWMTGMYVLDDTDNSNNSGNGNKNINKDSSSNDDDVGVGVGGGVGGWIPREMILGQEARARVPAEFITQRVNIANPPTLLLAVQSLIYQYNSNNNVSNGSTTHSEVCGISTKEVDGDTRVCSSSSNSSPAHSVIADKLNVDILTFLQEIYPALHEWMQWLLVSQTGHQDTPGVFRWRGRSSSDGKFLPNTLASGLDDYPRSAIPSPMEYHIDLLSWMVKSTDIMAQIQTLLNHSTTSSSMNGKSSKGRDSRSSSTSSISLYSTDYRSISSSLHKNIDALHWSEDHQAYLDVGLHSESGQIRTEIMVRCGGGVNNAMTTDVLMPLEAMHSKDTAQLHCPVGFPNVMFPLGDGRGGYIQRQRFVPDKEQVMTQHVPRIGYVSIFPLLLKLLPASSPRLNALLDIIESSDKLWTPFGLRSLAATDSYYRKNNAPGDAPYWRGPIWININYLAISALHHYSSIDGPYNQRCKTLYSNLRKNIMKTVLGNYERTGFFWEQYDDISGDGIRGHPFTGWTVLVLNIMAEIYN